ncbi:hypothetical protein IE81DRAFT_319621 [Ceraceosorus guamensis]|uniref:Uncharacterized protein n=1 Tax=Ceraceosorus guamensis TaxID=1522189 RepID=A0A316W7E0_9BASI|nr:hypothetical protein IE81DRAFT_319621 [Ceraceosorus guamensis]PWN45787.1 hypothetical protein IE81DRAFT_319621 [Ceraceosorus guamensis]
MCLSREQATALHPPPTPRLVSSVCSLPTLCPALNAELLWVGRLFSLRAVLRVKSRRMSGMCSVCMEMRHRWTRLQLKTAARQARCVRGGRSCRVNESHDESLCKCMVSGWACSARAEQQQAETRGDGCIYRPLLSKVQPTISNLSVDTDESN